MLSHTIGFILAGARNNHTVGVLFRDGLICLIGVVPCTSQATTESVEISKAEYRTRELVTDPGVRKETMASSVTSVGIAGPAPCPVDLMQLEGLDLGARYHSDRCGGDFFDGIAVGSRLVFLLTDIAGPRSEAHAIAAEAQVAFRQTARELFSTVDANESEAIAALAHEVNPSLIGRRLKAGALLRPFSVALT